METKTLSGEILVAQIDEFNDVYGCVVKDQEDPELVRCVDCGWEACPMRGKKEAA